MLGSALWVFHLILLPPPITLNFEPVYGKERGILMKYMILFLQKSQIKGLVGYSKSSSVQSWKENAVLSNNCVEQVTAQK